MRATLPEAPDRGLTSSEVDQRRADGQINTIDTSTSRSYRDIVRSNVLTRFNAIIACLAVIVLVFGHPIDALFALVMVANMVIGIVQEVRAKRTLDSLRLLVAPTVIAVRDGQEVTLPIDQLVVDDCIHLRAGDQVPVDASVVSSTGLEVDESALTGEADPIRKRAGDEVRSASAAVAGAATVIATRVGPDAWVHQLTKEAKEFVLTQSELRVGVDRILRVISFILPPMAALLFWSQLRGGVTATGDAGDQGFAEGMVAATAGVVALVPQGLVLLVSMAMAVAVVNLARRSVVVQELASVEGLARADVVCLDKTGTLTTGRTTLEAVEVVGPDFDEDELRVVLAALAGSEPNPTSVMQTVGAAVGPDPRWTVADQVPFSSARKWSSMSFESEGNWVVGAPEVVLDAVGSDGLQDVRGRVEELASRARRVLLLARSPAEPHAESLPEGLRPAALVVLAEELRPDAADIIRYFERQGVSVKIISGDSADTVAAIGLELDVPGAERNVDLRGIEEHGGITSELVSDTAIFGRVQPEQKREIVEVLQADGHTVGMTGDGVNDIPALKRADIGIAMDTATSATKAVSQLVLLNGRFDLLPDVVAEGRRVVANMERVSSLFVTKTVYAAVIAIGVAIMSLDFPFLPRHLTLIDSLTIGIPAFLLSFRAASDPCRTGYLRRVADFSFPAGLAAAIVTLTVYVLARDPLDLPLDERRTIATIALGAIGFWVLWRLIRPLDRWDWSLLAALVAVFAVVFAIPWTADFYALVLPDQSNTLRSLGLIAASVVAVHLLYTVLSRAMRSEAVQSRLDREPGGEAGT